MGARGASAPPAAHLYPCTGTPMLNVQKRQDSQNCVNWSSIHCVSNKTGPLKRWNNFIKIGPLWMSFHGMSCAAHSGTPFTAYRIRLAVAVSQEQRAPTRTLTFSTSLCWARKTHHHLIQYLYAGCVYLFLLILKQFLRNYNKKFQESGFFETHYYVA